MGEIIHLVGLQPEPGAEEKFNKWYENVYMPKVLEFKGLKKITRYKLINPHAGCPDYLTVYTFKTKADFDEYETTAPAIRAAQAKAMEYWNTTSVHPGKGEAEFEVTFRMQYEPFKTWIVKDDKKRIARSKTPRRAGRAV